MFYVCAPVKVNHIMTWVAGLVVALVTGLVSLLSSSAAVVVVIGVVVVMVFVLFVFFPLLFYSLAAWPANIEVMFAAEVRLSDHE